MIVQLTDEVLFIGSDWPDIVKKGRFLYIYFFFFWALVHSGLYCHPKCAQILSHVFPPYFSHEPFILMMTNTKFRSIPIFLTVIKLYKCSPLAKFLSGVWLYML